jgi:hypothetical protein
MVDETNVDTENLLSLVGPNDIIASPWGRKPDLRPLFDDYRRQNLGTLFAMPQKIFSGNLQPIATAVQLDPFAAYMGTIRSIRNMASFNGICGTIKLRLVLRSAVTAYGTGMISWYYGQPTTGATTEETKLLLSSAHAQIFDTASSPELTIDIPFISNREFLDKSYINYVTLAYGTLALETLDPAIPPTVYGEVWMHMEDVEVTDYVEAQSLPVAVRQQEYNIPGRLSLPVALTTGMAIANVGSSLVTSVVTQGYADLKKALYGELKEVAKSTRQKFEEKVNDKQKVSENIQTPVYQAPFGNLNSLAPTAALQTLTEMPMWKLDPGLYGDVENHSLADIVQNAVYHKTFSFTINGQTYTENLSYQGLLGYAGLISRHFRYARCRPRIGLWFSYSPLMSSRFQIRVSNFGTVPTNDGDSSTALSTLLVKGSSYHIIEIPYNHDSPVVPTDETAFTLDIKLISKGEPTTAGYVPLVNVVMFTSMGPNAQFFSVRNPRLTEPPPPPEFIEAQTSTRTMSRAEPDICFTSGPLAQISYMDSVDTVEELCSRWSTILMPLKTIANAPIPHNYYGYPGVPFANNMYGSFPQHFIPLFALWRGSRDFRYVDNQTIAGSLRPTMSSTETFSSWSDISMGNGGFISSQTTPIQIRVPFLTRYRALLPFGPTIDANPVPPNNIFVGNDDTVVSRAAPDFQLFHLNILYQ